MINIRSLKKQQGVTAMEYGVIGAVSIVAIVAALALIGPRMTTIFNSIAGALVGGGGGA